MTTCDICGSSNVTNYRDHINGTTCEHFEECHNCPLYMYEYHYGYTRELIGFVEMHGSYTDTPEEDAAKTSLRKQARKEALEIWNDQDCRALLIAIMNDADDDAPRLILADWLADHGMCEMQEQAIREECQRRVAV